MKGALTSSIVGFFTIIIVLTPTAFADPQFTFQATGGQNPSINIQAGNQPTVDYGAIFGWVFVAIIIIIIPLIIVLILYRVFRSKPHSRDDSEDEYITEIENETPLDILKTRLAKGEITKEEYDELKKRLRR